MSRRRSLCNSQHRPLDVNSPALRGFFVTCVLESPTRSLHPPQRALETPPRPPALCAGFDGGADYEQN